jgi:hypothetical protein
MLQPSQLLSGGLTVKDGVATTRVRCFSSQHRDTGPVRSRTSLIEMADGMRRMMHRLHALRQSRVAGCNPSAVAATLKRRTAVTLAHPQ